MTNHVTAKLIKSLKEKKHRTATKKFLVEGTKNVSELLTSDFKIEYLYVSEEFKGVHKVLLGKVKVQVSVLDASELTALGTLEHNDGALAVVFQKETKIPEAKNGVTLVLDDIRDPGNLGTIIRIADWYGVTEIVCSPNCVDWYNPKVIMATMGSFTRVRGHYMPLEMFLDNKSCSIIGAYLGGTPTTTFSFPENGILVIGSESHGISQGLKKYMTDKVTIPKYGGAESLNAGIASAVILDRWKGSN